MAKIKIEFYQSAAKWSYIFTVTGEISIYFALSHTKSHMLKVMKSIQLWSACAFRKFPMCLKFSLRSTISPCSHMISFSFAQNASTVYGSNKCLTASTHEYKNFSIRKHNILDFFFIPHIVCYFISFFGIKDKIQRLSMWYWQIERTN